MEQSDNSDSLREAKKIMEFVLLVIFSLSVTKIIASIIAVSTVLFVDALNTLSDAFMALAAYYAIKFMAQKPTKEFPYGYYRLEDFSSLLLSIALFIFSGFMIWLGINAVIHDYPGTAKPLPAILVLLVSNAVMFLAYKKVRRISNEINMYLLDLSSRDLRVDIFVTLLVIVSIVLNLLIGLPFEALASIIVALIVIRTAWMGGKASLLNLLDAWNKPEVITKIKKIIADTKVLVPGRIRLRQAGKYIFGDAQIFVPEEIRLEELDDLIEKVEKEIYSSIPGLKEITFDIEPLEENIVKCAIPVAEGTGRTAQLAESFDYAERLLVVIADEQKKIYEIEGELSFSKVKKEAHIVKKCKRLERLGIDCVITKAISDLAFMLLRGYSIDVYLATEESETVDSVMQKYFEDKLIYLNKLPQVE